MESPLAGVSTSWSSPFYAKKGVWCSSVESPVASRSGIHWRFPAANCVLFCRDGWRRRKALCLRFPEMAMSTNTLYRRLVPARLGTVALLVSGCFPRRRSFALSAPASSPFAALSLIWRLWERHRLPLLPRRPQRERVCFSVHRRLLRHLCDWGPSPNDLSALPPNSNLRRDHDLRWFRIRQRLYALLPRPSVLSRHRAIEIGTAIQSPETLRWGVQSN